MTKLASNQPPDLIFVAMARDGPGRRIEEPDGKEILVWDGKNSPLYASQQGKRVSRFLMRAADAGSKGRPFQTGKGKFGDPKTFLDPKERAHVDRVIKETDRIFFGDKSPKAKGKGAGESGAADKGEIRKGEIRKEKFGRAGIQRRLVNLEGSKAALKPRWIPERVMPHLVVRVEAREPRVEQALVFTTMRLSLV
ncbi:MAG: hypothetical protein R3C24_04330 [Cyanobacteriota/Melainabacteria group bacterium]